MDLKPESKKRISLFDVLLIFMLLLVVAGAAYWALTREKAPEVQLTYTVRFSGVENGYSGAFEVDKKLYTTSGAEMGIIRSVAVVTSKELIFDPSVVSEATEYAYEEHASVTRSDVVLTVTVKAEKRAGGYFIGNRRIASGMDVGAMVNGYVGSGMILTVSEEVPS